MLEIHVRAAHDRFVGTKGSVLLRIGDCSTDGLPGSLASLGQRIVSGVKILPVLRTVPVKSTKCPWVNRGRTFCAFSNTLLWVGSLPYRRKSFCSSSLIDYKIEDKKSLVSICHVFRIGRPL